MGRLRKLKKKEEIYAKFWYKTLNKKKLLEAICLHENMILKLILKTWT